MDEPIQGSDVECVVAELKRAAPRALPHVPAADRDDLIQAASIKLMERAGSSERSYTRTYFRKVLYSCFIDEMRRRQRRRESSLDQEAGPVPAAANPDPEARAAAREQGRAIQGCLEEMIPPRRRAVTLRLQGHSIREVGRILRWAEKRAENLIYRGMADLRKCLEAKGVSP